MKILMSNPSKTLGFVIPESTQIQEIGLFNPELIKAQIKAIKSFDVFTKETGSTNIKLAIIEKGNLKFLAMRPADVEGDAWVVSAPRIESD